MDDFWIRLEKAAESYSSKKKLCEAIGIAPNSFSNWRKRRTYPSAKVFSDLCAVLGIAPESLLKGLEEDVEGVTLDGEKVLVARVPLEARFPEATPETHVWKSPTDDNRTVRLPLPFDVADWIVNNQDIVSYLMLIKRHELDVTRVQLKALAAESLLVDRLGDK